MLWRVRMTLADRPGTLALLTRRCGDADINILDLQVFPTADGVTDELVLCAPDSWQLPDVAALVEDAGGRRLAVSPCTAHALHDAPTRYLRAAERLVADPSELLQVLTEVLDASEEGASSRLSAVQDVLEFGQGADAAAVRRVVPFTDTERARAAALIDLAGAVCRLTAGQNGDAASTAEGMSAGHRRPSDGLPPSVRIGTSADVAAVTRMYDRCSADTVDKRFHTPIPAIGKRLAHRLVSPSGGTSLVAVAGEEVVGVATIAPYDGAAFEVGLVVEDAWQRQGLGSTLLHQAARVAKALGADEVRCLAMPDNAALLRTVTRAGLRGRARLRDGTLEVSASVRRLRPLAPVGASGWDRRCVGKEVPARA